MNVWHYRFDGGPEKTVSTPSGLYQTGVMAAFAQEDVKKLPTLRCPSVNAPYDGHVLEIWVPDLLPDHGPYFYGIGVNPCGALTVGTALQMNTHSIKEHPGDG